MLQPGVEGQADGVAGVGLSFREITLSETEPAVIRLQMYRRLMQLHTNAGSSKAFEHLSMISDTFILQTDHC